MGSELNIKGGEFLVKETKASDVFIPEEWSEEQKMIAKTCYDFVEKEVWPYLDEIDSMKNPGFMPSLLDKAGALGLLGTSVPPELGGFGMSFNTTMLVAEALGASYSFAVAYGAHTGIGTLPILYFGTEEQKKKYVPKLATGEWKACYCLTEPDSGSDANSGKTRATPTSDGKHYLINGQKMWITNGGFADVMIVFAKIDQDKNLTAFIVERGFGGITMNEEEKKMGIKGSSTRQIFFNDCKVPVENMLSERENGFKIAVNVLNIGRIKLGAGAIGGAKMALQTAAKYATERKQFGQPIASFGAIRYKLGDVASRIFASEAAHYRAGQNIDDAYDAYVASGMDTAKAKLKSLEEYAIECAILKVNGSEVLDYSVDEGVQIFGGMGYSAEGPMERAFRDARINRIFEGTNEINRLLTIDMLLKRAMKGTIDLMTPTMAVQKELMSIPDFGDAGEEGIFVKEKKVLLNLKKAGLMVAGAAIQKFMMKLSEEQEIIMNLADMLIEGYVAESALLRAEKLIGMRGAENCKVEVAMAMIALNRAVEIAAASGREALCSFAEGDELRMMLMGLKRFTKIDPYNLKEARRLVSDHVLKNNGI
ncbi:MAG: acyl-CoA dehydrogenase family protein [Bacteroidetes bacterium]|nr:acyl-CoA dehydrogenase family protein [Bacteroidota bacterium]